MQPLSTYIHHPELIDAQVVGELWRLVDSHPTFQAARMLLLRGLYQLQDERFGDALRHAALFMPDRVQLFELIEGDKYRLNQRDSSPQQLHADEPAADRTQSLIDSFLSTRSGETRQRRTRPVDASVDYMSYLEQLDDAPTVEQPEEADEAPTEEPMANASKAVLAVEPDEQPAPDTLPSAEKTPEEGPTGVPDKTSPAISQERELEGEDMDENAPSEDYFTETLARIYIKQCKYDKAIEIIRRLSLNYPKKSRYFADQIRFLRKLILNEQCKKGEK
ncbi:MAG: hypothetical protein K6C30_04035 [Bacteroidaceae bacterium]|nr:hypothetical protein [Bacteroidaceae bacterium]